MSSREVRRHNETVLESLEPGDLVEFPRGVYSHWAVYVGDNQVVHLSGVDGPMESNIEHSGTLSGQEFNKGIVRKDGFWEVVGDSKVKKNNSKDNKMSHFERSEIVLRANARVGEVGYNILSNNCEHFTSWCRHDIKQSDQADGLFTGLAFVGAAVVLGFGMRLVHWLRGGKEKDKEKEAMH